MPEWFESGETWYPSKWGADDELGTLNLLTPEKVISATRLVKKGKVYRLGSLLYPGMPGQKMRPVSFLIAHRIYDPEEPSRWPSNSRNKCNNSYGRLEMSDHTGTHLDTLNHISLGDKVYNGIDSKEITTPLGTTKLGIEKVPPIVTRGVMVNVAEIKNKEILDKSYPITIDDTMAYLQKYKLTIERGDAVLFYTGVSKLWMQPQKWLEYGFGGEAPGIGYELAKWLAAKDIAVAGTDCAPHEVCPSDAGSDLKDPVHQYFLTKSGIRTLDGAKLDELARDKVSEFLFIASPLPMQGMTASPISPVAIT